MNKLKTKQLQTKGKNRAVITQDYETIMSNVTIAISKPKNTNGREEQTTHAETNK